MRRTLNKPADAYGSFGNDADIGGGVIVVSDTHQFVPNGGTGKFGAAYVYKYEGAQWVDRMKFTSTDLTASLGDAVAIAGNQVILGGTKNNNLAGSAYLFDLTPNPLPTYGVGCVGGGGFVTSLSMELTYDGCKHPGDPVAIAVEQGLGGSLCLLFLGATPANLRLPGGCSLLIVPTPVNATFPLFDLGPGGGSISINAAIPAGFPNVSLYMQGFVIDPGVPQGYSATNGLRLTAY